MTRRQAIRLLKTSRTIVALDLRTYLTLVALKVEIGTKDLRVPLANIVKDFGTVSRKSPDESHLQK